MLKLIIVYEPRHLFLPVRDLLVFELHVHDVPDCNVPLQNQREIDIITTSEFHILCHLREPFSFKDLRVSRFINLE